MEKKIISLISTEGKTAEQIIEESLNAFNNFMKVFEENNKKDIEPER